MTPKKQLKEALRLLEQTQDIVSDALLLDEELPDVVWAALNDQSNSIVAFMESIKPKPYPTKALPPTLRAITSFLNQVDGYLGEHGPKTYKMSRRELVEYIRENIAEIIENKKGTEA